MSQQVSTPSDERRGDEDRSARYDVKSLLRAFDLLDQLANLGGQATVSQLAATSELPVPTAHRLARTLVSAGALRQLPSRRYLLGPRLIRLGEMATHMLGATARPVLTRLADTTGESANMAVLDQDRAVYVAHEPSKRSMRMFTEVGRRVSLHSTGVGKAILAALPDDEIDRLIDTCGLPARTPHTITERQQLRTQLERIRRDGYAIDDEEEELGVRCVAVAVTNTSLPSAISISAPAGRLDPEAIDKAVGALRDAVAHV